MPPDSPPPMPVRRSLGDRCRRAPLRLALGALIVLSLFFLLFPAVDFAVSGLFYHGNGQWERWQVLDDMRAVYRWVLYIIAAGLFVVFVLKAALPDKPALLPLRIPAFLLSSLLLGPILLVHALKEIWGRARPRDIDAFGGDLPFSPAWVPVDHCSYNCSFTSGEGAATFWLIAFAFVVPPAWRAAAIVVALAIAVPISLSRVMFGAHFASDVVLSWALTLVVILLCRRFFLTTPQGARRERVLEDFLTTIGTALRKVFARR
ncbi:MAG: phosphatase PAP2 family protein [Alphaproteobacteria bacterium]|nr:phosphatase PAP2 family protein [Alphaproteobacteria bacterium]